MRAIWIALLSLCVAGCGSAIPQPPLTQQLSVTPVRDGDLRGDVHGLRLWGVAAWDADFSAPGATNISIQIPHPPARFTVTPGHVRGRYTFQARTVVGSGACGSCNVVVPGTGDVYVTASWPDGQRRTYRVPVSVAHKIVAISLNPLPNPSIGGSDAVLQYYDGNTSPSVIWDDFDLKNATAFPNVTGLAFGADGSLYVANSGVSGVSNGTVTEYAPGSTKAHPVKTFASRNLKSAAAVALDAHNNVYVADNGYETVTRFPHEGGEVTWRPGWEAGADVIGVAVDAQRNALDIAMSGAGDFNPPHHVDVGRLAALPLTFTSRSKPLFTIDSTAKNGVNEPYGIAVDARGRAFVVNDYVSIVEGPPGPGPEYSTLTSYASGITSSDTRPNATSSRQFYWPLSVAVDASGSVYVGDNTTPSASGKPGTIWLDIYDSSNISVRRAHVDLSKRMPAAYGPYFLNIQGIAVEPGPLRR